MGGLDRLLKLLTMACAYTGMVAIILIMCVTVANVIARKVFATSVPSAVEGSEEALVVAVFLGFGAAQRTGTHVATHILTSQLHGRVRTAVRAVGVCATLVLAAWMLRGAVKEARYTISIHEQIASVVNFPTWPGRIAVAVGFSLLLAEVIRSGIMLFVSGPVETPQAPIQGYTVADEDDL